MRDPLDSTTTQAVVSRVSHELRTPLTVALLSCELLKASLDAPDQRKLAERTERSIQHLREKIEEILAFASAGRIPMVAESDLREVLADVRDDLRSFADVRGVGIAVERGAAVLAAFDPLAMRAALKAILHNALRFSPRGETVSLELEPEGGQVLIRVCDRGPGIPADLRDRIFESFFQCEEPLTRKAGGLGLGLSTALGVISAHGGTVTAHAREGGGTAVSVRLPRRAAGQGSLN